MLINTIGDFDIIPESLPAEGDVSIKVRPIDLIAYWKRCGVMADFAAAFYAYSRERPKEHENSISTVFNELIENATKYSVKRNGEVDIHMKLYNTVLKIQVENYTTESQFKGFQKELTKLTEAEDLDELYIDTLAKKTEDNSTSGIGLMLLVKDYKIKIGGQFHHIKETGQYKVIIQIYYYIEQ